MSHLTSTEILVPGRLNADTVADLKRRFTVHEAAADDVAALAPELRARIRGVAAFGGVSADLMRALPHLEIVANFGVGYDGVDTAHAVRHGIMVTNTPDVLTEEVADTALGLLLMTVRELGRAEQHLRAGRWEADGPYPLTETTLRGRTAGIMGLGRIGMAIARRLEAFGLPVHYHNRRPREGVPYRYHDTLEGLARAVDTLVIAAPGGSATDKAVNRGVLEALGATGVLVNIGRGTTVDEEALADALEARTIQAAGLDVFAREPKVPERLRALPNAVLLPHVASASRATRRAMGALVVENLARWFESGETVSPVPEAVEAGIRRAGAAG